MIKTVIMGAGGRMGKALVTQILESDKHELHGAVDAPGSPALGQDAGINAGLNECGVKICDNLADAVKGADAVIDFSSAAITVKNAELAKEAGASIVIGTTGLSADSRGELKKLGENGARIVFAPNMSIGVNLLFHLCAKVAPILGEDYDIEVVEMHHNQKKDAPSGTAVRLGEILCEVTGRDYEKDTMHGRVGDVGARTKKEIGMHALRGGDVVGDHTVMFSTGGERVELTHKASSRDTFAKGAVRAVTFLSQSESGLYDMQDVLGLN